MESNALEGHLFMLQLGHGTFSVETFSAKPENAQNRLYFN